MACPARESSFTVDRDASIKMCVSQEMEDAYGFCFDEFRTDLGNGWDDTIQAFLLNHNILVTDEGQFGRAFLDFLEDQHEKGLIEPAKCS